MDKRREIESFEESLRRKLESAEVSPTPQLWSRIEASIDRGTSVSPWILAMRWGSLVAASLAVAFGLSLWMTPNLVDDPYEIIIAEFEQIESLPLELTPIRLSQIEPKYRAESLSAYSSELSSLSLPHEEEEEGDESYDTPQRVDEASDQEQVQAQERLQEQEYTPTVGSLLSTIPTSIEPTAILGSSKLWRYTKPTALVALLAGGATYVAGVETSSVDSSPAPDMFVESSDSASGVEYLLRGAELPNSSIDIMADDQVKYKHLTTLSYAMSLSVELSERWSLESGVTYNRLSSDVISSLNTNRQVVQFIGVPLRINYNIYTLQNFSLYAGAGLQVDRCISATLGSKSLDEFDWHSSSEAALGVQYNVISWLSLYVEPRVQYYFTPTKLTTIRTESPVNFDLRCGVRFRL